MKAMVLAAGLGTRLKPVTSSIPKALAEINGTPILHILLKKLTGAGFNEIIINIHHKARMIRDSIKAFGPGNHIIEVSDESEELLETGGGLVKASWFFDDDRPFLLHNVDVLSNIDLLKLYQEHSSSGALATLAVSERATSRYLLFDGQMRLHGWANLSTGEIKPPGLDHLAFRQYAFSGIHILNRDFIDKITEQGKFSLTEVYIRLCRGNLIRGYLHPASGWIDIGTPGSLKKAEEMYNKNSFS